VSTSVEEAPTHFEILISIRAKGLLSLSTAQIAEVAERLRRQGVPAEEGAVTRSIFEVLGA
jgi:hypothetical protein